MTPLDATKRLQLVVTDPLPSAACELCPAPCADGETCFCDIGSELLSRGIRKFKEAMAGYVERARGAACR